MESIIARDLFVKLTDPTGKKKPVINQHRVWDAERFIAAQAASENTKKALPAGLPEAITPVWIEGGIAGEMREAA